MSMFDIPDKATSMLMERFYDNWLSSDSKSSALRNASLSILNERREANGAAHPLFWGGFILVGDPN
jgi:CHAT domain-containing protein